MTKTLKSLTRENLKLASEKWSGISKQHKSVLRCLTATYRFAIGLGDLLFLNGSWYVTHAGLLRLAERRCCIGIAVQQVRESCDPIAGRWVFKATVYKKRAFKGFVGHGDADPSNVSSLVRGAELRIAETRAVNRALRKAYGIGICSLEELGALSNSTPPVRTGEHPANPVPQNGSNNGQPRLRDKLCLLIRHFNLDANLVKAYAADFCGTETLRGASRELVESFITQIEKEARTNRDQLVCKLNSYSHPVEVQS